MIHETLAALEQLSGALHEIGDVESALATAQSKLGAVTAEIERKIHERDAVAKQVGDFTEKARKLTVEVQALESQFAETYEKRNRAQGELHVAQEHLRQLREKVGA